jgi:hypothetical protein
VEVAVKDDLINVKGALGALALAQTRWSRLKTTPAR